MQASLDLNNHKIEFILSFNVFCVYTILPPPPPYLWLSLANCSSVDIFSYPPTPLLPAPLVFLSSSYIRPLKHSTLLSLQLEQYVS